MSVWRRMRGWFVADEPVVEPEHEAPVVASTPPPETEDPFEREAAKLVALAQRTAEPGTDDQAIAIEAFERLCDAGREVVAIDLARRVLASGGMSDLRCRVAERLDARGDESTAWEVLAPMLREPDAPLDGWMLAAEIAERRGDARGALSLYERIVARDLDYPRARERVARLREKQAMPRRDEGATLMADGALARGRYKLLRELGRGGAGTVFLADDTQLARPVALKVYHRRGRADRERLLLEARMASSLEHPGVIRVLDVDETLGAIAMENLELGSIRTWLGKGAIRGELVLPWVESAIDALRYVHARGVVHRDLKPSNLLLRTMGRVVLTDFGTAQRTGDAGASPHGLAEGTLAYMPPEQRAGAPAHFAMDVYALGATVREICGQLDAPPPDALVAIATECVRPDPAARPSLDALAAVVRELR
ncbi:serine/threonine-protein kinase [Sandaracinus amylolyticus]|uniref:Serine/threonine protein kinase n=1 Tax=Sandaracinus amylolyticus TaxID=927083 RepID=A0A0F6YI42_9BACT|nr:serine/threonine-protein kinase [Sandaracinus amylolyticus]AKF06320.1 serine/threonine protein kinase [Sandaracinus amylolyticus]